MASKVSKESVNKSSVKRVDPAGALESKIGTIFHEISPGNFRSPLESYIGGEVKGTLLSGGASKPVKIDKMGGSISSCVVKLAHLELGYEDPNRSSAVFSSESDDSSSPIRGVGCPPGGGAFVELLGNQFISSLLSKDPRFGELCMVPKVAFAEINPDGFLNSGIGLKDLMPSKINGVCVVQEFVPGCVPVSLEKLENLDPLALELLAVIDIVMINTDRHQGNILLKEDPLGNVKIVMIDHANCFPRGGLNGGRFFWLASLTLDRAPSEKIREFIASLNVDLLLSILEQSQLDLTRHDQTQTFGEDRILPHMIAVTFLQEAILHSWSLHRIGKALTPDFLNNGVRIRGGIILSIYNEISHLPRKEIKDLQETIRCICQKKIEEASMIAREDSPDI